MAFRPRVEVSCWKKEKGFSRKDFIGAQAVLLKNSSRLKREMKSQKLEFYTFFSAVSKMQL